MDRSSRWQPLLPCSEVCSEPSPHTPPRPDGPGRLVGGTGHDWEPTIAADPNAPYVYVMYNRFGGPKACKQCPGPAMLVADQQRGRELGPETSSAPAPECRPSTTRCWHDIERRGLRHVDETSTMVFSKSPITARRGPRRSRCRRRAGATRPGSASARGRARRLHRVGEPLRRLGRRSHDGGATFSAPRSSSTPTPASTATRTASRCCRTAPRCCPTPRTRGSGQPPARRHRDLADARTAEPPGHAWSSIPFTGVTWTRPPPRRSRATRTGTSWRCTPARPRSVGTATSGRSALHRCGATWARGRSRLRIGGAATRASRRSRGTGSAGSGASARRTATGSWNTYFRSSSDGGQTWSAEQDISDASRGATYKTAAGFEAGVRRLRRDRRHEHREGDGGLGRGRELRSGPGGIWFNRQT